MTRRIRNALFESWRGLYSDSPRAISQEIALRHPEVRQYWVADPTTELPAGVYRVRRHSVEYFWRLVTCDLVVANDIISKHLVKGPRSTYLQTWHGTALKHVGHDEAYQNYSGAVAQRRRMDRDVPKWDLLLSPAAAATEVFRGAFGFRGRVLEVGYPRNDVLRSPQAGEIRERVRRELGLRPDQRAVLYAPTWRDDSKDAEGRFVDPGQLDLRELADGLRDDTVVLMRMHRVVRSTVATDSPHVIDVSDVPDVAHLYLAADVLVSDYSSAVFDFAVTGKPIVLFAYDLERYRDATRGLYYDYHQWAPGPVTTTTAEIAAVLDNLDEHVSAGAARYAEFVQTYCPHEDGHAAERVVTELFGA